MYVFICYWIVGFNDDPFSRVLKQAFAQIAITFAATGLGILIGCMFNDLEVALNITPLIFFPMMLFSGFYVNSDSIAAPLKIIEYIQPLRYCLEGYIYAEYEGAGFTPQPITALSFDMGYWTSMMWLWIVGGIIRVLGWLVLQINASLS